MAALTQQQHDQFQRDGFFVYPNLLSAEELTAVSQRIEDIVYGRVPHPATMANIPILEREPALVAAGVPPQDPHDELRKLNYPAYFDPVFERISRSARVLDIVEELIGPDIFLQADQMFLKPPFHGSARAWHQDSGAWAYLVPDHQVTVWIAIDEATVENGCLHYIRGSHRLGIVHKDYVPSVLEQDLPVNEVLVPVPAGGAVIHHASTFHASGPNNTAKRRRGWALHYMASTTRDFRKEGMNIVGHLLVRGRQYPGHVHHHVVP